MRKSIVENVVNLSAKHISLKIEGACASATLIYTTYVHAVLTTCVETDENGNDGEIRENDIDTFKCQCMGVTVKGSLIHAVDCDDWNWHLKFEEAVAKWVAAGKPNK